MQSTTYITIILIAIFLVLLGTIIGLLQSTINKAIRRFIIPDLKEKGYVYKGYESVKYGIGDFTRQTNADISTTPFVITNGSPFSSFFFYIYYKTPTEEKRVTARIDTSFFFIQKVKYSHKL